MSLADAKSLLPPWAFWIFIITVLAVLSYWVFNAVDTAGISEERGLAEVVDKRVVAQYTSYRTEIVGDRRKVYPVTIPQAHVLDVLIDGEPATMVVSPAAYAKAEVGGTTEVLYRVRRLSGMIEVLEE